MAALLGVGTKPAAGQPRATATHHVTNTTITVTAGKPSELAFKLSKTSIPAGKVTFKVTNKGKIEHDFEICSKAVTNMKANSCTGKTTKLLKPGQSATLVVTMSKKGKYEFLCTVPGHAGAGMKGLLGVAVKVAAPPPPTKTTTTPTTTTTPVVTSTCAQPQTSTVNVSETEYTFTFTPSLPVHCGTVTFVQKNNGTLTHNFDIQGVANGAGVGGYLEPGQSTSFTIQLGPGNYAAICDVPEHVALGMALTMQVVD